MKYIKTMTKKGALRTPVVKEIPSSQTLNPKKGRGRKAIQEQVFDIPDSVADNAKMISLLFSVLSRMWESLPEEQKNSMDPNDVALIDQTVDLFNSIDTRADDLFASEGFSLIERLLTRQQKIKDILVD